MSGKFKFAALLGVLAAFIGTGDSANILAVYTSHSPSHVIIHMSYVRALVERGHNVTVVTTLPLKDKNPRFNHIFIPPDEARMKEFDEMKAGMTKPNSALEHIKRTFSSLMTLSTIQADAIKSQRFQDFMHNPDNKFDVLILGYFLTDYQLGLGLHFKCPVVLSWVAASNPFLGRYVGNPAEIAYVPASPMGGVPDALTFTGRLKNVISGWIVQLVTLLVDSQMESIYKDIFPASKYASLTEAGKKVSVLFSNSHFSEGVIRPNVPAAIDVGGIQIKDKPDPLPKDLLQIVNASSEHGVILFSFGSNIRSTDLNQDTLLNIFKALAGLKQTVIWKLDGNETPGSAPNIHYQKWMPQDDLLAHPNLKLFITHAGKGGVAEAQYHGVPMVAVPIFGDQFSNAEQVVKSGFGLEVSFKNMTTEAFRSVILEVLENPKYLENIRRFSTLYRDRPMTARQTAVYWIEYVIRHKGAYHMQSPLVHLNIWQYISLDVLAFLLFVVYLLYKLVRITARFALSKIRSLKQKVKQQ